MKFVIFFALMVALVAAQDETSLPSITTLPPKPDVPENPSEGLPSMAASESTTQETTSHHPTEPEKTTVKPTVPENTPDKAPQAHGSTKGGASSLALLSPVLFLAICLRTVV